MLSYLHMQNFALIDDLSLELFPGMNVLTGETGAGKSILIGAINLIIGERASSEQVRTGSKQALIEAVFSVSPGYRQLQSIMEANGLDFQDELIISREITRNGRNICRVNGRIVTLGTLKELGSVLVDLHGQYSHQSLLKTEQHLFLLDEFGDEELLKEKRHLAKLFDRWEKIRQKLKSLGVSPQERARQLELLRYQRDEITGAALSSDEEKDLLQRQLLLNNMEKLLSMANKAYGEIYSSPKAARDSAYDKINSVKEEMSSLLKIDDKLAPFIAVLGEVSSNLSELSHELYDYMDNLTYFPEEMKEIENRLELYRHLKRKYGTTVEEILRFAEKCQEEIAYLENSEEEALKLEEKSKKLWQNIERCANLLTEKRHVTAQALAKLVKNDLEELGMENASFDVNFIKKETPSRRGNEEIEFLFSANPGEPLKPLVRIISAGEMARVMLSLKSILAEQDYVPTLIFDEIDSGIGGKTILKVAEKMAYLSKKHQVICVTHSPQLASVADHQYYIFKDVSEGRTITDVKYLEGEKRIMEIARMLNGGTASEITKKHAAELLKKRLNVK
ncbi:MAG: DNA repair protein RecN [Firmicutes bacterium]|nr:DNA repair protein RecN [Bacillota bacterium]